MRQLGRSGPVAVFVGPRAATDQPCGYAICRNGPRLKRPLNCTTRNLRSEAGRTAAAKSVVDRMLACYENGWSVQNDTDCRRVDYFEAPNDRRRADVHSDVSR
jgi:hypothetical protein